jgi:transcriptional regulator with XRE-family HTH domain
MKHFSDLAALGSEVARLRKEKGLTQKELGDLAGLAQSTLARFETGRVSEFGSRKLLRVLEILDYALTTVPLNRKFTLDDALEEKQRQAGY